MSERGKGLLAIIATGKKKPGAMMHKEPDADDKGGASDYDEDDAEPNEGMKSAAEELMSAITAGDTDGVARALKAFYDNC